MPKWHLNWPNCHSWMILSTIYFRQTFIGAQSFLKGFTLSFSMSKNSTWNLEDCAKRCLTQKMNFHVLKLLLVHPKKIQNTSRLWKIYIVSEYDYKKLSELIDIPNHFWQTPLYLVSSNPCLEWTKFLIENLADLLYYSHEKRYTQA